MTKTCKQCAKNFELTEDDSSFYEKVSPVFQGKKYLISTPSFCSDCSLQRKFVWRNDRHFYERKCNRSGQDIISMFSADAKVNVYHKDWWWKDDWDAKDYGQDFDFSRSFFSQFSELIQKVPHAHTITVDSVNSLYTNYNVGNKNCYLCAAGNHLEDSYYCYNAQESKNCCDCLFVFRCELCYQCVHCESCYNTNFALNSKNCADCFFIEDCNDLQDCVLCFNLKHKRYCILNKQYTKEEYQKLLANYELNTLAGQEAMLQLWRAESLKYPKKANHNNQTENCTGDYILQSKNCHNCFIMALGCEDCKNIFNGFPYLKDSYNCAYSGENATLLYECMGSGSNVYNTVFGYLCLVGSSNLLYSTYMFSSKNCFGCSNMRNAEYCILNKQYSKEEYEALVPKIIEHMQATGEWGDFFPPEISPFHYEETLATEYFPLNESGKEPGAKIFNMIKQEIEFYQKKGLPAPTKHPDIRHLERLRLCNPARFWQRDCANCQISIQTTYAPDRPETVYCENCYLNLVY
ncbi:MAG: hypothetical protein HY817_04965 [Candidatus Abawacabacteria bacterium]|nr:hypothetical protein [Candidatus Abawacabacteria bacterium]